MDSAAAYWRLSSVYFFFFALLGVQAPYWAPYLAELGFSPERIGLLLAIFMFARIGAPVLWQSVLADRLSVRQSIWLSNALTLVCFAGVFADSGFWWLALVLALFSFCWNAVLPLYESFTLAWLDQDSSRYSRIRLWGSLGFIVAVVLAGWVIEHYSALSVPWMMLVLLLLLLLAGFFLPKPRDAVASTKTIGSFWQGLMAPDLILFFSLSALMQVVHGPYYSFYSIHLSELGFGGTAIGGFWALGVVVEVLFFWWAPGIIQRTGVRGLFQLALLLAALRWALIGFSQELLVLLFAQLLHAATYGCFHVAAMEFIHRRCGYEQGLRAQAVYGGLCFGGGSALGALAAGYLWSGGGAELAFGAAALLSLLGLIWSARLQVPSS